MRKSWGMNSILHNLDAEAELKQEADEPPEVFRRRRGEGYSKKNREDHRHHALDAIVVAYTTPGHIKKLAELNRDSKEQDHRPILKIAPPFEGFRRQAKETVEEILVSYKCPKSNKYVISKGLSKSKKNGATYYTKRVSLRGELHKETVYGKHDKPGGGKVYHARKPLDEVKTQKHVKKIVDCRVRELVHKAIEAAGGYDGKNIPKGAFFEVKKDEEGNEAHVPKVFLPNNKGGDPVPVRKVRMKAEMNNAAHLKEPLNQYVDPQNNHHAIVYKDAAGKLQQAVFSFWEIVERVQQGGRIFELPEDGVEEVVRLQKNDTFLLGLPDHLQGSTDNAALSPYLYKVKSLSKGPDWLFQKHLAAEAKKDVIRIQSLKTSWKACSPIKVRVDVLGKIHWL